MGCWARERRWSEQELSLAHSWFDSLSFLTSADPAFLPFRCCIPSAFRLHALCLPPRVNAGISFRPLHGDDRYLLFSVAPDGTDGDCSIWCRTNYGGIGISRDGSRGRFNARIIRGWFSPLGGGWDDGANQFSIRAQWMRLLGTPQVPVWVIRNDGFFLSRQCDVLRCNDAMLL